MEREVVEVVARFGATIVDLAHVGPTGTYRIGTAPGVDLAIPGLTCFPLVDGNTVRCPVGVPMREDGSRTELRAGAVTIHITRTKLPSASLARPGFDWRPPAFVLASLLAHLAVWLAAMRFEPLERLPSEKPRRYARLKTPPPEPPPVPAPTQVEPKQPVMREKQRAHPALAAQRARAMPEHADTTGVMASAAELAVAGALESFDDTRVVERVSALTGDVYSEDAANAQGFGGGRRFDPSEREGFGTIETGAYATMMYPVKLCPNRTCKVVGPLPALYVRTHLLAHMDAIYDCYAMHASEPGTIVLEFTVTADGLVREASGSGLGETGACAARAAEAIIFRAFGRETRVRYPILFK